MARKATAVATRDEKRDWEEALALVSRFLQEADKRYRTEQPFTWQYVASRQRRVSAFINDRPGLNPNIQEMLEALVEYARGLLNGQTAGGRA